MRIMKQLLIMVVFLMCMSLFAKPCFVSRVNIKIDSSKQMILTVVLSKPSEIKVYYDTQQPANTEKLFQFWFSYMSSGKKKQHKIVLKGVSDSSSLYFRFEKKTGIISVSRLYCWQKNQSIVVR